MYNLQPQMINQRTLSACNNAAWCIGGSTRLMFPWLFQGRAIATDSTDLFASSLDELMCCVRFAGEVAIKCSSEELKPFALQALERFVWILQVLLLSQSLLAPRM